MQPIIYRWSAGGADHALEMVHVEGTKGQPYSFGEGADARPIDVRSFYIASVPVIQPLWAHVMGDNAPSIGKGCALPVENVSWDDITRPGGFIDCINESEVRAAMSAQVPKAASFRLPSETEWEFAARGGPHWRAGFRYSGSNDIDQVAWYDRKDGDHTQPVAKKTPNQLGIYDMSGNVWEWCHDTYTTDINSIPADGSPFTGEGAERVLRGGCFHNWAIHCTVSKRYQIARDYHDGCIGLRLVLGISQ